MPNCLVHAGVILLFSFSHLHEHVPHGLKDDALEAEPSYHEIQLDALIFVTTGLPSGIGASSAAWTV